VLLNDVAFKKRPALRIKLQSGPAVLFNSLNNRWAPLLKKFNQLFQPLFYFINSAISKNKENTNKEFFIFSQE
jgi:hypothetical protein